MIHRHARPTVQALPVLVCFTLAGCGGTQQPAGVQAPAAAAHPVTPAAPKAGPAPVAPVEAKGKPSSDVIPLSVLFGNPDRAAPKISPDGKRLAYLAAVQDVLNVYVAPSSDLSKARPVTSDKKRPVTQYFWAHTNKHILYLQDAGGDENFHVFSVNL
ncbi:MAG: S9 family peptidase, partial [Proteobacteria bacterium]|nr:S9 family peptidase [Pseudomonadota bacterium]